MTSPLLALVVVSQVFLLVVSHEGCQFDDLVYPYGDTLNDLCAPMICLGHDRWNWTGTINPDCMTCIAYCDPHVVTFDNLPNYKYFESYSYQGCGEYSMTQPGFLLSPSYGVFATFDSHCGDANDVSCVSNVTFKQDQISIIADSRGAGNVVTVEVDGYDYTVPPLPTFVPPGLLGNDKVMGWRDDNFANTFHWGPPSSECVFFQGTKGLLIAFCGNEWANTLYIWAMPKLNNKVNGLCGTITDNREDDYKTRDGVIEPYPLTAAELDNWAESWLTSGNGDCPYRGRRSIQDIKTTCIDFDTYEANCNETILRLGSGLTPYEIDVLTGDCTFDLCHVDNPTGYLQGAVAAYVNITTYIKSITITEEVEPTTPGSQEDRILVQVLQNVNV